MVNKLDVIYAALALLLLMYFSNLVQSLSERDDPIPNSMKLYNVYLPQY